ncbi:MAG: hypothetical protein HY960_14380 [Ignavibacteriae bacterium]|nr:hypothetical protein [Ignavibacteriota bacterium]
MDKYSLNVFINCPFDSKYSNIFEAIVFAVFDCGYIARCAWESDDGSQVRIEKLYSIIKNCQFGVHDISRTELDTRTRLPRFNMPLELGIFLGAKAYGSKKQKRKICLILDKERYRYQKFISDISGQDIQSHQNNQHEAINLIRNWLQTESKNSNSNLIPSGSFIFRRFSIFKSQLPELCSRSNLDHSNLIFGDYVWLVATWLQKNAWSEFK